MMNPKPRIAPPILNRCAVPGSITSFKYVWMFFKKMPKAQRTLFSEAITVLKLILVMPATNASSERSFSEELKHT